MAVILKASDTKWGYIPTEEEKKNKMFVPWKFKLSWDWVFHTIQWEWTFIWKPTTFIRLNNCNLACSRCFVGSTPVMLSDGGWKNIEELQIGDKVLSHKDQKITESWVEKGFVRKSKTVTIVTENGDKIECTPDHMFYTNRRTGKKRTQRCMAKDLKGEHIKYFHWYHSKIKLDEQFARGYLKWAYVWDGNISNSHLYFQVCDLEFAEAIQYCINLLWGNVSITESSRKTIVGKTIYRVTTWKKSVINQVLEPIETRESAIGYIAWFYDAEWHTWRNQISFSQKDQNILKRLKWMLFEFWIVTSDIKPVTRASEFYITGKNNINTFFDIIPIQITRKIPKDKRNVLSNVLVTEVIENIKEKDVYDIQTTTWNFFAKNYLVENCDAWYTRKQDEKEYYESENIDWLELYTRIIESQREKGLTNICKSLTFTWWEPLLQQRTIWQFIEEYWDEFTNIQIETNWTIPVLDKRLKWCYYNCSPKIPSSDNETKIAFNPVVLKQLVATNKAIFKFVFLTKEDVDYVLETYKDIIPLDMIWFMPEWVTKEENTKVFENTIDYILSKGVNVTIRAQNIMWDWAKRGV